MYVLIYIYIFNREQSDWLRDRKSGSIELKGRKNQEKKIVIDTQSDPEDQPQVQTKGKLVS